MTPKVCNTCKHLDLANLSCSAFPKGIPMQFLSGDYEHAEVVEGQTGQTVWELREPKAKS